VVCGVLSPVLGTRGREVFEGQVEVFRCEQCGRVLSPVEAAMGPVCGRCARENHRKVVGGRAVPRRRQRSGCGKVRGGAMRA